jgi:hypothetical protein
MDNVTPESGRHHHFKGRVSDTTSVDYIATEPNNKQSDQVPLLTDNKVKLLNQTRS